MIESKSESWSKIRLCKFVATYCMRQAALYYVTFVFINRKKECLITRKHLCAWHLMQCPSPDHLGFAETSRVQMREGVCGNTVTTTKCDGWFWSGWFLANILLVGFYIWLINITRFYTDRFINTFFDCCLFTNNIVICCLGFLCSRENAFSCSRNHLNRRRLDLVINARVGRTLQLRLLSTGQLSYLAAVRQSYHARCYDTILVRDETN